MKAVYSVLGRVRGSVPTVFFDVDSLFVREGEESRLCCSQPQFSRTSWSDSGHYEPFFDGSAPLNVKTAGYADYRDFHL